jgi:glycosyltransferase involved in cell wall biosynthesis
MHLPDGRTQPHHEAAAVGEQAAARGSRVLLVSCDLDPVGTGRQVELIAAGLVAAGHDVHLGLMTTVQGAARPSALATRVGVAGGGVHRLGHRPTPDPAAVARLVRLGMRLGPAVVVSFGRRLVPAAIALRTALPRARVIAALGVPVRRRATRLALTALDLVVASSVDVARSCRGPTVEIIPPGIRADPGDGRAREAVARRLGLDPGAIWTLCVAPLEPGSRLDRLLWAIDQLGVVHRGLEHVLVGAGPVLRRVRRRAVVQELDERLLVTPRCAFIPDLLTHVRLIWQSGEVACGGAILDGMARGVPAVMVAGAAARQLVVDGETGRVVPALPESELPRRTLEVIEDDALAARLGAAATARAAAIFPADALVARWVAVLTRFLT